MAYRLSFLLFSLLLLLQAAMPVVSMDAEEADGLRREVLQKLAVWANENSQGGKTSSEPEEEEEEEEASGLTEWTACIENDCSPKRSALAPLQFAKITKNINPTTVAEILRIPKTQHFRDMRFRIGPAITLLRLRGLGPALANYKNKAGLKKFLFGRLHAAAAPVAVDVLFNVAFWVLGVFNHDYRNSTAVQTANVDYRILPVMRCFTRVLEAWEKEGRIDIELALDTPLCLTGDTGLYMLEFPVIVTATAMRNSINEIFLVMRKDIAERERYKTANTLQRERLEGWKKFLATVVDRVLSDRYRDEVADLFKPELTAIGYAASEGAENLFYDLFRFDKAGRAEELVTGFKQDVAALHLRACHEIQARADVFSRAMEDQLRKVINQSALAYVDHFSDMYRSLALIDQQDKDIEWISHKTEIGKALIKSGLKKQPRPDYSVENVNWTVQELNSKPLDFEGDLFEGFEAMLKSKSRKTLSEVIDEATVNLYPHDMKDCSDYMTELLHGSIRKSTPEDGLELRDDYVDCADEAIYSSPHIVSKVADGRLRCGNVTESWTWSDGHLNLLECHQGKDGGEEGGEGEEICQAHQLRNLQKPVYRRAERSGVLDMRQPEKTSAENPTGLKLIDCRAQDFSRDPDEQERLRRGYIGCLDGDGVWFWNHNRLLHCQRGTTGCETFTPGNMSSGDRLRATEAGVVRKSPEAWSYMEAVDCNARGVFKNLTLLSGIDDGRMACGTAHNKWFWIKERLVHCAGKTCQSFTTGQIPEDVAILARKVGIMSTPPEAFTDCHENFFSTKDLHDDVVNGKLGCGFEYNYWVWRQGGLRFCSFNLERPCAEYEFYQARESEWPLWKMPMMIRDCRSFSPTAAELKSKDQLMWSGRLACGNETDFWMWNEDKVQRCRKEKGDDNRQCAFFEPDDQHILTQAGEAGLATYRPPPGRKENSSPSSARPFRYATESFTIVDCKSIFIDDKEEFEMWEGKLACGNKTEFWLWNSKQPRKCQKDPDSTKRPDCADYYPDDQHILKQASAVGLVTDRPASSKPYKIRNCKALPPRERIKYFDRMWEGKMACGNDTDWWKWKDDKSLTYCTVAPHEVPACSDTDMFDRDPSNFTLQLINQADEEDGMVNFPKPQDWEKIRPTIPYSTHDGAAPYALRIEDCRRPPRDEKKKRENIALMRQGKLACGKKADYWRWSGPKTLQHCRKVRHREELSCRYAEFGLGYSQQVKAMEQEATKVGLVKYDTSQQQAARPEQPEKPEKQGPKPKLVYDDDDDANFGNPGIYDFLNEQEKEAAAGR
ncbi:hypothetical protein CP532_5874 [Ophiocordyceps camponoti-leonardi (nom. inval.)]|nr:hypothetical protein CP532_5874 [Ophiocordyceps camponoti-leonardi (nom. inval.)]